MRFKFIFSLLLLCALLSCAPVPRLAIANLNVASADEQEIPHNVVNYEVIPELSSKNPRDLKVTMFFYKPTKEDKISVQLPVWSPGDYNIQNHAQYIQDLQATLVVSSKVFEDLPVTHTDANTWEIACPKDGKIVIRYLVQETPPGNFSENVHLTKTEAFANGPALFLYLVGHKDLPIRFDLNAMEHSKRVMPLDPDKTDPFYLTAPDYDTFADSPLLISLPDAVTVCTFNVGNTTFRTVFFGDVQNIRDANAYTPVIQKLVQAETAIMGPMPTTHYDFFFDVNGRGGGLEHLNSCRIALPSFASPQRLAPFVGHEFFHLWNIKRIRPEVLGPFDYIQPPKTRNLWFAEGVTEYYAYIATRRADLSTDDELLSHFRSAIRRLSGNAARTRVTADEASLRVWETKTSEGYGGLSYYAKGELIGLCMDLKIRQLTNNRKSLDDMMRLLMQRHAPPKPGYKEDELRDTLSEVAGQDLSKFYDQLARSTDELPFAECLGYAGLDANCRPLPTATVAQRAFLTHWLTGK